MKTLIRKPKLQENVKSDSFEKGRLFEEYIIKLFNQDNFQLKEWRKSEKLEDKVLLRGYANPDLELIFGKYSKHKFAVECKWRERFFEGKIEWASEAGIRQYKEFENDYRMPVFIAIGIGGHPSNPKKLYVTPLRNLEKHSEVYEVQLIPYKRKADRRFFYDTVQLRLF